MESLMIIDIELIIQSLPQLISGIGVTLNIASIGCFIGLTLGTILALMQTSKNKILQTIVGIYVTIIRGTPMLIQIFCAYYVLPQLGIRIAELWAAIFAIGLNSAAYISQIIRSGITSVGSGQIEAAKALGLSTTDTVRYIILPQAIRIVLPSLGNEFITLIKDSALASVIGIAELSKQGRAIINKTHDAISIYFIVALLYLIITSTISLIVSRLEKRMSPHA
jgi:polar amino acid transport system permease protein